MTANFCPACQDYTLVDGEPCIACREATERRRRFDAAYEHVRTEYAELLAALDDGKTYDDRPVPTGDGTGTSEASSPDVASRQR